MVRNLLHWLVVAFTVFASAVPAGARPSWSRYVDPELGFAIDLPTGSFVRDGKGTSPVRLTERGGDGVLEVYGGTNSNGLNLRAFEKLVGTADRIGEVTYHREGRTWFVLSGYYRREGFEDGDLIFYAKFMFSPDLKTLSAFEISYPVTDKKRFDPIVEHLQATLTSPQL